MNHAQEAVRIITGDRNDSYGTPDQDFHGIALMWSGLLNTKLKTPITAEDVPLMMCALKLRREAHKSKHDNVIDAHGYLLCLEWMRTGQRPTLVNQVTQTHNED
jgi:hypothetical protein